MTAKIKLNAASGGGSVSLKAPSTTTSNAAVELQLPVADGSANQVIKTDGSGALSFSSETTGSFQILVARSGDQTGYNANDLTSPIIWNNVITGQSSSGASSHYNTSTGLLTAPVTGAYFFHIAVNCNFSVENCWLIINGSRANYSVVNPNGSPNADQPVSYYLTAGDTVGVKWYDNGNTNGTINANALHTWWRIILLG